MAIDQGKLQRGPNVVMFGVVFGPRLEQRVDTGDLAVFAGVHKRGPADGIHGVWVAFLRKEFLEFFAVTFSGGFYHCIVITWNAHGELKKGDGVTEVQIRDK